MFVSELTLLTPLNCIWVAPLSIASLNTNGLNDPVKCSSAFTFLHIEGNEILLLQECNVTYRESYKVFKDRMEPWPVGMTRRQQKENFRGCSMI